MKRKKYSENNKGFSLVEVLLAIVILGLISAPILQMFYSSYKINEKSKRMLTAAELAQTTLEALSSQTYDENLTIKGAHVADGLGKIYHDAYANKDSAVYLDPNTGKAYGGYLYTIPLGGTDGAGFYYGPVWQYAWHDVNQDSDASALEEEYIDDEGKNPSETGIKHLIPNVKPHEWETYYFQNVKYPENSKEELCVKISFDKKEYTEGSTGVMEVRVDVYGYTKEDLKLGNNTYKDYFRKANVDAGKFEKLESVSTFIPVKHID